jgi:hypothetical protein
MLEMRNVQDRGQWHTYAFDSGILGVEAAGGGHVARVGGFCSLKFDSGDVYVQDARNNHTQRKTLDTQPVIRKETDRKAT